MYKKNNFSTSDFKGVQKNIIDLYLPAFKVISESVSNVQKTAETIKNSYKKYVDFFESINQQVSIWQKWIEKNNAIFKNISDNLNNFKKKYDVAELEVVSFLKKYRWFISPSMPVDFIFEVYELKNKKGKKLTLVNNLFVDYFSKNNWENLELLTENWNKNVIFKKRLKIINDCLYTIRNSYNKVNVANVVLPTLIAQIDGFLTDYLNSKNIPWDTDFCEDYVRNNQVIKRGRKTQYKNNKSKILTNNLDDLANDVFLNILFQNSRRGKNLDIPFNFNRHKIIHGESTRYGKKDYLIRAFLILDYLIGLK